jgi:hypothetical protein
VAGGGTDRRLAELAQQAEDLREALGPPVLAHERDVGREAGEVAARAERPRVRGGQDDAPHGLVVAGAAEGVEQVAQQLVGQRVARVRVVERHRGDPVGDVVADPRLRAHRRRLYPRPWGAVREK